MENPFGKRGFPNLSRNLSFAIASQWLLLPQMQQWFLDLGGLWGLPGSVLEPTQRQLLCKSDPRIYFSLARLLSSPPFGSHMSVQSFKRHRNRVRSFPSISSEIPLPSPLKSPSVYSTHKTSSECTPANETAEGSICYGLRQFIREFCAYRRFNVRHRGLTEVRKIERRLRRKAYRFGFAVPKRFSSSRRVQL